MGNQVVAPQYRGHRGEGGTWGKGVHWLAESETPVLTRRECSRTTQLEAQGWSSGQQRGWHFWHRGGVQRWRLTPKDKGRRQKIVLGGAQEVPKSAGPAGDLKAGQEEEEEEEK